MRFLGALTNIMQHKTKFAIQFGSVKILWCLKPGWDKKNVAEYTSIIQ